MATLSASFLQLDGTSIARALSASWLQVQGAPAAVGATPVINGPSGVAGAPSSIASVSEGTSAVYTFTADRPVTWSLDGGADAARFSIDPTSGALSFIAPLPSFLPGGAPATAKVRKASNATVGAHADGFVLADYAEGDVAEVQIGGVNSAVAGLAVGPAYLGFGGRASSTAPPTGAIRQLVGYVVGPTSLVFQREPPLQT